MGDRECYLLYYSYIHIFTCITGVKSLYRERFGQLSNCCRGIELSRYRAIEVSSYRGIELSSYRAIELSSYRAIELSSYPGTML